MLKKKLAIEEGDLILFAAGPWLTACETLGKIRLKYGAPPHGGIALGFDRLCAILCGTTSIRDVIAFPKTAKGADLMTDAPAQVTATQLRDLYLELKVPKKE